LFSYAANVLDYRIRSYDVYLVLLNYCAQYNIFSLYGCYSINICSCWYICTTGVSCLC